MQAEQTLQNSLGKTLQKENKKILSNPAEMVADTSQKHSAWRSHHIWKISVKIVDKSKI